MATTAIDLGAMDTYRPESGGGEAGSTGGLIVVLPLGALLAIEHRALLVDPGSQRLGVPSEGDRDVLQQAVHPFPHRERAGAFAAVTVLRRPEHHEPIAR